MPPTVTELPGGAARASASLRSLLLRLHPGSPRPCLCRCCLHPKNSARATQATFASPVQHRAGEDGAGLTHCPEQLAAGCGPRGSIVTRSWSQLS